MGKPKETRPDARNADPTVTSGPLWRRSTNATMHRVERLDQGGCGSASTARIKQNTR